MKTPALATTFFLAMCIFGMNPHAGAAPLRSWPTVALGEHDGMVRALQFLLSSHGYSVSSDGFFGRGTEKTLRKFQQAHQLVASGETNDPTWEALLIPLHQGSKGPAVRAAQFELRQAGYAVGGDGVFGSQLKAVVQKYQKQTGHTVDGIIGRNTWYELLGGDESAGD
ncbi:MAG: peptidoglycan-binding domain-containing protein [Janthinobacterium lividum]